MIIVVVAHIKRQVAINAFQQAGPIQASSSTRTNASLDRIFGEMFDDMAGTTPSELGFGVPARIPLVSDMLQPEVCGFYIDCALPNVVLNIRVVTLSLGCDVTQGELIGCFCCSQKCRRVMGYETGLPTIEQILPEAYPPDWLQG